MEAAGIAPGVQLPQTPCIQCSYGDGTLCWLEMGWKGSAPADSPGQPVALPAELRRVIEAWGSLPEHLIRAILALVESHR